MHDRTANIRGPLYDLLQAKLPAQCTENGLNILLLRKALGMSHEGVYKFLRKGRLSSAAAKALVTIGNSPENKKALSKLRLTTPKIEDFYPFLLA